MPHCHTRYVFPSVLFAILISFGKPISCQTKEYPVIRASREIGVSFRPSYIAYDEYSGDIVQDSEHGWIPGVGIKATAMVNAIKMTNLLLAVTYDYNNGGSNHWSLSLTGGNPLNYSAPFRSNDVLLWIGKGILPTRKVLLTAQTEAEYREWLRLLPKAEVAIRENYTFWAPGAAIGASYNPASALVLKGKAGFEYPISPTNTTVANPNTQPPIPDATLALGHRPIWHAEGGVDWAIARGIHTYADGAYSRFGFGRSANSYYDDHERYQYEPSSVTHLTKIDLGLAWSF
jgi:hypothetical protein